VRQDKSRISVDELESWVRGKLQMIKRPNWPRRSVTPSHAGKASQASSMMAVLTSTPECFPLLFTARLAVPTIRAYEADFAAFKAWCQTVDLKSPDGELGGANFIREVMQFG
jgi:hypothetical protein